MSSSAYTPGSVAKLLGTTSETHSSVAQTKLQALFSTPQSALHKQKSTSAFSTKIRDLKPASGVVKNELGRSKKNKHLSEDTSLLYKREASLRDAETETNPTLPRKNSKRPSSKAVPRSVPLMQETVTDIDDSVISSKQSTTTFKENASRRVRSKRNPEQEARTVFIGNVALTVAKKTLLRMFSKYGKVECIRLRSVGVADMKLPRRASVILKNFHPSRQSANAYIVFSTKECAEKALSLNGTELEGLHIRVDMATASKKHDHKHSVFIGNLPFDVQEEAVRKHFEVCGDVTAVRLIRDRVTGAGKGIGYVAFSDAACVSLALSLNNQPFCGRLLRIERSVPKPKPSKKDKKLKVGSSRQTVRETKTRDSAVNSKKKKRTRDRSATVEDSAVIAKKRSHNNHPLVSDELSLTASKKQKVLDHKKVNEQKKKKLRKKALGKKKAALGELLTKTKQTLSSK